MTTEEKEICPHCGSPNVECINIAPEGLFSYEWFCPDCGEQWDWRGLDTK